MSFHLQPKAKSQTCTVVELPRNLEFELAGVTRCGDAKVLRADSDIDMLCDMAPSALGVAASDVPAPFNCDRHDTDHGRALLPARFLRSCTYCGLVQAFYQVCYTQFLVYIFI